jgi:predicted ATPase
LENTDSGRLLVVTTRRANPEPTGPLAELGAALARRGATRLSLTGLTTDDVGVLADAMTGSRLDPTAATALHARTGGNPFFVLELLRSPGVGSATETSGDVPVAVADVIAARVGTLPPDTRRLLQDATALGRHIDIDLLGRLDGIDAEAVLEGLEPAHAAGLIVVDAGDGALRFSHALVHDAIEAMTSPCGGSCGTPSWPGC